MMRIGIFGATGFIGAELARGLRARGDEVVGFSRKAKGAGWRTSVGALDLRGLDAVVNLAGESVAARWTAARKERIEESRVGLTERIVEALEALPPEERPEVLLNGSAIGIYGGGGDEPLTEDHAAGNDYLARLCVDWEGAALGAEKLGVRVVLLRTGIVIGEGGEAWERMLTLFRRGLGGRLGNGRQWMPWIHLRDEVGAIMHLLDRPEASGPFNLVSPGPVRNAQWTRDLAKVLKRPAILPAPGIALKAVLGGFGNTLLASFRVQPARLQELGYSFVFADLPSALRDLTGPRE